MWLTSATNPESGTTSYTYNADGTLATKTDPNGNTESYTYDANQRLTAIPDRQQTFTYDTCPANADQPLVPPGASTPGPTRARHLRQQRRRQRPHFEYNYAYTPAGMLSARTLEVQSTNHPIYGGGLAYGALTANYAYDGQGALTSLTYPQCETWATCGTQTVLHLPPSTPWSGPPA